MKRAATIKGAEAYVKKFRDLYCYPAETASIRYVGVWDTAGELGIPSTLPLATQADAKFRFFDTGLSPFTASARHAVAIDERRDAYKPTLWDNIDLLNQASAAANGPYDQFDYQQKWFPGHHSGVGGGQMDHGLCLSALRWIAEGAEKAGLVLDQVQMAAYRASEKPDSAFLWNLPVWAIFSSAMPAARAIARGQKISTRFRRPRVSVGFR